MKKILLYTFVFIAHFSTASVFSFQTSSNSMKIQFEKPTTIFNTDSNYIVGAFVKRDYKLICIGSVGKVTKPITILIDVYGYDGKIGTALEGEKIIFAATSITPEIRCEILLTPIDEEGNEVEVFFKKGSIQNVYTWKEQNPSFEYPKLVCGLEKQIFPVIENMPSHAISIYRNYLKEENKFILLNVSTGDILTEHSKEGTYMIRWQLKVGDSDTGNDVQYYCIQKDTFQITLVDTKKIDSLLIDMKPAICEEKGQITIDTKSFSFEPISFILKKGNEQINSLNAQIELSEGDYQLIEIVDKNKCVHPVNSSFKVPKAGNCGKNYVLIPSLQNAPQEILFEQEGEIKIVNQQGKVVKTLIAPNTWDGRTANGNYVDMGVYFIYYNQEFLQTLHVYR